MYIVQISSLFHEMRSSKIQILKNSYYKRYLLFIYLCNWALNINILFRRH